MLPGFDSEAYCEKIVGLSGPNSEVMHCSRMDMALEAYGRLKSRWADLTNSIRGCCDKVAAVTGEGSYSTLKTCVEMDFSGPRAADNRSTRRSD